MITFRLKTLLVIAGFFTLSVNVMALTPPPSKTLEVYSPGTFTREFNGVRLLENVMQTGLAAADTPVCQASGQTSAPCNVVLDVKVNIDTIKLTASVTGTINVIVINTSAGAPLNQVIASYPMSAKEDFSTVLTTGAANFTGDVNITGQGSVSISGNTLIPFPCGMNTYCYADGTAVNIGDLNSLTNAPVKVKIHF